MQLELVHGDITTQHVDAIVNAADPELLGGGGVDGAVHAAGGPAILTACRQLRATTHPDGLPRGEAVATTAGDLPARWVIHTVGPVYGRGTVTELRRCYLSSLRVADELGARTLAFPLVSAGAFGWPLDEALEVAIDALALAGQDGLARLVLYSDATYRRAVEIAACRTHPPRP